MEFATAVRGSSYNFRLALRVRNDSVAADVDWHTDECGGNSARRRYWIAWPQVTHRGSGILVQGRIGCIHSFLWTAADLEQFQRVVWTCSQAACYCRARSDARQDYRSAAPFPKSLESIGSEGERNDRHRECRWAAPTR